jgi:acetoin utilization protein AcuB
MESIAACMTEFPVTVSETASVSEAIALMKTCRFRHLPVMRGGQVTGIISERDLRQAEILSDCMTTVVSDFMTPRPYCVRAGTPILEVVSQMSRHKYGSAIVTSPSGKVLGIFTTTDALDMLARHLGRAPVAPFRGLTIDDYLSHDSLASA